MPVYKRTACCLAMTITALVALSRYNIAKSGDKTVVADSLIRRRLQEDDTSTVTSISLIGERHSGTNWITDHLTKCFSDDLTVKVTYSRFKHWFQYDTQMVAPKSTVVVAMFRDPYDWVEAMHERPHHAHSHMNLPWKEFVNKPWRGPRKLSDYHLLKKSGDYEKVNSDMGNKCIANYTWNEVIPCAEGDFELINGYARYMYELMHDGSGRAYSSIIDLRREKILNFLTMEKMRGVKSFHPTRYEELYKWGTKVLLELLERETGKKAKCDPIEGKGTVKHKIVTEDFVDWMNKYVDWAVEDLIGYKMRNV